MAINKYPYTNFNEYNLDWIINKIKEFQAELTDYEALHSITFGGDWDISKSYTQWTIVSDPITHDGYLSLQPVPANVPITNTAYWLKIADYTTGLAAVNARVDAVEADITDNIKPDIDAVEADITDNIKPDIDAIEADITDNIKPDILALDGRLDQAESDIAALQNTGRKIIIFGDSYFMDNPPSGDQSFRSYLESMTNDVPGFEWELHSDGGEGFGQSGTYSFLYDVTNYTSAFDADEVTDVFFVGGYNDRNNAAADIKSGMASAFAKVWEKYPKANISVGFFGWDAKQASTDRDTIVTNAILNWHACTEYGAAFMVNSEYTMHNYDLFYTVDNFHPNGDGHKELAKQILLYILSGTCDVHYPFKQLQFNQGDIVGMNTASGYNIGFKLDNDQVTFYLPNDEIIFTTNINPAVTGYTQMLQFTTMLAGYRGYAMGMYDAATTVKEHITANGYLVNGSGDFRDLGPCNLVMTQGFLYIRPYGINADRDGFEDYTDTHGVHFIGGAVTIPTLAC